MYKVRTDFLFINLRIYIAYVDECVRHFPEHKEIYSLFAIIINIYLWRNLVEEIDYSVSCGEIVNLMRDSCHEHRTATRYVVLQF